MSAGREHPGMLRIGVMYVCARCAAGAELRAAIARNDEPTARYIAAHAPGAHAADCERATAPMFTVGT